MTTGRYFRAIKGIKQHQWVRRRRKGKRRKGILWDYNWDGIFSHEQIKGIWKRYWRRYWRRKWKKETNEQRDYSSK